MTDIVIVNWNSGDYLYKCIKSIFNNQNEIIINKIFIIDNNSFDNSLKKIILNDKIVVVKNKANTGFAKACNQGFQLSNSEYVLLLNPDAQLHKTTLEDCVSFMDSRYDIDILGCRLIDDEDKISYSCARFPKPIRYFYDALGLSKLAPSVFKPALLMTDWNHKESKKVDQVIGAFMFMRRSLFQKIGYFDERFFVYYEELDFSKRLTLSGGTSFYNYEISAIHSGEGTTSNVKSFRLYLNLQSRLQYSKKYFQFFGFCFVWFCTFCIEPFSRNIFLLLKGNIKEIKEVFKAYILLIKNRSSRN